MHADAFEQLRVFTNLRAAVAAAGAQYEIEYNSQDDLARDVEEYTGVHNVAEFLDLFTTLRKPDWDPLLIKMFVTTLTPAFKSVFLPVPFIHIIKTTSHTTQTDHTPAGDFPLLADSLSAWFTTQTSKLVFSGTSAHGAQSCPSTLAPFPVQVN